MKEKVRRTKNNLADRPLANETMEGEVMGARRRKARGGTKKNAEAVAVDGESLTSSVKDCHGPGVTVSVFDYSVENHLRAMDMISKLCGEAEDDAFEESEIERLSSTITFLREWKHYCYKPRIIRFACETGSPQGKYVVSGINLPQFSAATVPKERLFGDTSSSESSKDFVLYVGGPVWALDWCPRVHQRSDCHKCEFIAVAAHPPESSHHKIGAPLTGRGVIQIWCLLNVIMNEEEAPPPMKKSKGKPRNNEGIKDKSAQPKRPRGRPRKKPINESLDDLDCNNQFVQALAVQFPEDSSELLPKDGVSGGTHELAVQENHGKKRKGSRQAVSACNSALTTSAQGRRLKVKARVGSCKDGNCLPLLMQNEEKESSFASLQTCSNCGQDPVASTKNAENNVPLESSPSTYHIPKDVALPRLVLCLAHNGKVAWDVKWQPSNVYDSECKHRMGYLAVLLGNGSLEVWEVPLPRTIKVIYSSCQKEGTDPRFLKLEPVFRCSKLMCSGRQSIPLTVEWSASFPHDFILAGCHDGTVALWKFSASGSSKDTRPLLCFSADTVPIRALAWAPVESDPETANIIVTAGHEGLKFWDIRDPFRPLWDLIPVRRVIYSLDWLSDPRCVILSFDDGTLRILSLAKAACDVPVTGKPFVGTQQQGLPSYYCSSFSIWSVQVSRPTGMVAYCSADGTVLRFQLTSKSVEKDLLRNRAPHFLCGSLTEEESVLTVNTPLPDTPFPMKKSLNEWGDTPRTMRGFLSDSNQAKRAKDQMAKSQMSDDQTLALCYDDDPGIEFGSEDSLASQKSKQTPKPKISSKKKPKHDQALVCRDEEPENLHRKENEKREVGNEIDVFPPKVVAMHRVRWNMNKGSERWLCYGGAAGIVRCQEIAASGVDKKSLVKR